MAGTERVPVNVALASAQTLLQAAGLDAEKAAAVARRAVEGELLGHRAHGLHAIPIYVERLLDGRIATQGEIQVLSDSGSEISWQANRLPGAWIMERLVDLLLERSAQHAVVTATVANCTHIGALQAYLEEFGRRKLLVLMMVTDPGVASVAPPGGVKPVITTNPIAACIPTSGDPILIDQTTSLVSNNAVSQYLDRGASLPGEWVVDGNGRPSTDPSVLGAGGSLMSLGGTHFGYKGFGFGLLVEAYALALAGFGRDRPRTRGAQGVFFQVVNPTAFGGGLDSFLAATDALVNQCMAGGADGIAGEVRLPGQRALAEKHSQQAAGLLLESSTLAALNERVKELGLQGAFQTQLAHADQHCDSKEKSS